MADNNWRVEFYGEGTSWTHDNLTIERARKIIEECPDEYMAFMVSMPTEDYE